jgi:hypothetical protein
LLAVVLLIGVTVISVLWLWLAPWWSLEIRGGLLVAAYTLGLAILDRF